MTPQRRNSKLGIQRRPTVLLCAIVAAWSVPALAYSHPGSHFTLQQYQTSYLLALVGREPWYSAMVKMIEQSAECLSHESTLASVHTTFKNGKRVFYVPNIYEDQAASEAASDPL